MCHLCCLTPAFFVKKLWMFLSKIKFMRNANTVVTGRVYLHLQHLAGNGLEYITEACALQGSHMLRKTRTL